MIHSWNRTLLVFATAILLTGCDDGPTQVDPNAAVNAGANGPFVDSNPRQQLGAATGGTNASQICGAEKRRRIWEGLLQQPVVPFRGAGGLDASANLAFTGVTIDQLESGTPAYTQTAAVAGLPPPVLGWCQGDDGGAGLTFYGEQGELQIRWSTTTRLITSVQANSGYRGELKFTHPTNNLAYIVSLQSKAIKVNGQDLHWNWRNKAGAELRAATATKLYNAMVLQYNPDYLRAKDAQGNPTGAPIESKDCTADGGCIATILGNTTGAIAISPLGFIQIYFDLGVDDPIGKDLPTRILLPVQKNFAYASLPVTVKMPGTADQTGPISTGAVGNKTCVVKPGVTYSDFVNNCIKITGAAATDDAEEKKFLAGVTHGPEQYRVDVIGIDPLFLSTRIRDSVEPATITDKDLPEPNDPMNRLTFDQQIKGKILNDYKDELGGHARQPLLRSRQPHLRHSRSTGARRRRHHGSREAPHWRPELPTQHGRHERHSRRRWLHRNGRLRHDGTAGKHRRPHELQPGAARQRRARRVEEFPVGHRHHDVHGAQAGEQPARELPRRPDRLPRQLERRRSGRDLGRLRAPRDQGSRQG